MTQASLESRLTWLRRYAYLLLLGLILCLGLAARPQLSAMLTVAPAQDSEAAPQVEHAPKSDRSTVLTHVDDQPAIADHLPVAVRCDKVEQVAVASDSPGTTPAGTAADTPAASTNVSSGSDAAPPEYHVGNLQIPPRILKRGEAVVRVGDVATDQLAQSLATAVKSVVLAAETAAEQPAAVAESPEPNQQPPADSDTILYNPTKNGGPVSYLVNEAVFTLQPGETHELPAGEARVHFHRGSDFGEARYSIAGGVHEFRVTRRGWDLFPADGD